LRLHCVCTDTPSAELYTLSLHDALPIFGKKLEGLPNHLSIHAGGIVISERPLYYHTALQMMPKGFPIVQFDMYAAEDMGFYKYRSEEHSLNSSHVKISYAVFCLKKKRNR